MSNIYVNEPVTNGKVCIHTSVGDIDIELWSKECPKAVRNFVQLCLEGYYDTTIFHRVVPGFIVQGGDPTGTGHGGQSIYGEPFKDEFHQRLRFTRRGLVAMANAGKNDNSSQFFFTLDKTTELEKKHTIFGKVVGATLFNMLKLGEADVDQNERPLHPHRIINCTVLNNPFPDIVPRAKPKKKREPEAQSKSKATKNFNLLSFGEEAEEDEEEVVKVSQKLSAKGKSAHDLLEDEKLSAQPAVTADELGTSTANEDNQEAGSSIVVQSVREKIRLARQRTAASSNKGGLDADEDDNLQSILDEERHAEHQAKVDKLKSESRKIKRDLMKELRPNKALSDDEDDSSSLPAAIVKFRAERAKYLNQTQTQARGADRESSTMDLLDRFKNRLTSAKSEVMSMGKTQKSLDERLELHQQTMHKAQRATVEDKGHVGDGEADEGLNPNIARHIDVEDFPDDSWMAHKFQAEESGVPVLAKDANLKEQSEDWYSLDDPRHPINKRRRMTDTDK